MKTDTLRGDHWAQLLRRELDRPPPDAAAWVERHSELLKSDRYSRVGLLRLADELCYLKLYLSKSRWQQLGFRLGKGRGVHGFDAARALRDRGIAVPEPRACLLLAEGMVLLTEAIAGGRDLKALWQLGWDERTGTQLMVAAGEVIGGLHRTGFAHGDCKWSNLLWSGKRFYLADLEAVKPCRAGSAGSLRDLARFTLNAEDLALPRSQFETFVQSYLETSGLARRDLEVGVRPVLNELRRRHAVRYGERGHQLLGGD